MRKSILITIILIILTSCQTKRSIIPSISGTPRSYFKLEQPIIISLNDNRSDLKNTRQTIENLQKGLKSIYGSNIEFKPYFEKTEGKTVSIKINIKQIEANFGTRILHYRTFHNQVTAVAASVSTNWGSSVATAIVSQPVLVDNFIAEGYWIGTSYLEITMIDNLFENKEIYTFPFVAENKQNNTFGYSSANKAAKNSWNEVSSHLLDLIDAVALRIIETKN